MASGGQLVRIGWDCQVEKVHVVSRLNSPGYLPSHDPQHMDMSSGRVARFGPRQGLEMCVAAMGLQDDWHHPAGVDAQGEKLEMVGDGEPL